MQLSANILVVDDDPDVLDVLATTFGGTTTVTARSVEEAVERLRTQVFDCVLSDLNLGDGDGIDVLVEARARQPATRRWLITGDPDPRVALAVTSGLAAGVVRKPWTLDALRAVAPLARRAGAGLRAEEEPSGR